MKDEAVFLEYQDKLRAGGVVQRSLCPRRDVTELPGGALINSLAGDASNVPTCWFQVSGAARLPPMSHAGIFERSMSSYLPIEGGLKHAGLVLIDLIRSCLHSNWPSGIVLGGQSFGSGAT